jgi:cytochrome c peroxidase
MTKAIMVKKRPNKFRWLDQMIANRRWAAADRPFTVMKPLVVLGAIAIAISLIGIIPRGAAADRNNDPDQYHWPEQIPYPTNNPYSEAKLKLGRMLFFDPVLSGSGSRSCATCHNPGLSWADGQPRAVGLAQEQLPLRTPTLLGVAWIPKLGWNGRFRDLESVAITPITSPKMMNLAEASMVERLSGIPGYIDAFNNAFGTAEIDRGKIEQALATFERSIMPSRGRFDSFIDGDKTAIDKSAARGFDLFNGKANCAACHSGWAFTDASFHDIGSAKGDDRGRGNLFANSVMLQYAFKTPTLRDVARRAPYMHDGSVPTLDAVIDLYDRGGIDRPSRSPEIHPLGLTNTEKADLIAFLQTLTGEPAVIQYPVLPR